MQDYKFTELTRLITVKSVVTAFNAERKKDYYFAGEMHNFWELVYVVSGEIMTTADERVFSLSEGQLIFHKPMEFHRIWSVGDATARLCIISFDAEGEGMKFFENKLLTLTPLESERFISVAASFKKVIRGLRAKDFYDQAKFRMLASKTAIEFENLLLEFMNKEDKSTVLRSSQESQYEYIVSVINEHVCEALSQEQIAKLCSLSVSNMKRIFHLYSDIGVMKYFTSVKLRHAMKQLCDGKPIVQVADELGFSSTNYFHAVFKKETGMTPKEYIAKNRAILSEKKI